MTRSWAIYVCDENGDLVDSSENLISINDDVTDAGDRGDAIQAGEENDSI